MKIALHPFDSKMPNLALMKISRYHKSKGDETALFGSIEWAPDKVYCSVVFPQNKEAALGLQYLYPDTEWVFGGSGISYECLPDEIEHSKPDYDLYGLDFSLGFTSRGCLRNCGFCIVPKKEGFIRIHSPLKEFLDPDHGKVVLLDNNILASPSWKEVFKQLIDLGIKVDFNQGLDIRLLSYDSASLLVGMRCFSYPGWKRRTYRFSFDHPQMESVVRHGCDTLQSCGAKMRDVFFYILCGYNTTVEEDVKRVEVVKEIGAIPFIMKYNRGSTPELNKLCKWVNHIPYYRITSFEEFNPKLIGKVKSHTCLRNGRKPK